VPGDRVFFNKRAAAETEIDGVKYLVVRSIEVLCKIKD
jgi:co-chaperonin GroES (HSP10)